MIKSSFLWTNWVLRLAGQQLVLPNYHTAPETPLDKRPAARPNIVFVLTDDQDLHMNSLEYLPSVQKHLLQQGTFYKRHFCTIAICCPSRVSLWTGKAAHNTNVTDVNPPYGGYPKFVSQGFNDNFLPVWLQEVDYNTYYTGKLFNAHTVQNYDSPHVNGFTGSVGGFEQDVSFAYTFRTFYLILSLINISIAHISETRTLPSATKANTRLMYFLIRHMGSLQTRLLRRSPSFLP
jgi:hypothetical protein